MPLSYGEAIGNIQIKIQNDEMISLNMNEEKFRSLAVIPDSDNSNNNAINEAFPYTVRDNRFISPHRGSDGLDTIKKLPLSEK